MTIEIKNTTTEVEAGELLQRLKVNHPTKGLRKHFGLLKRNIDALSHQKELRNEWN